MSVQEQLAQIAMEMPDDEAKALLLILGEKYTSHYATPASKQPGKQTQSFRELLENDSFVTPTERGRHADAYMEEIRGNDRV